MRTKQVIRVFLASPSDLAAERDIVDKTVTEINKTIASKINHVFELVRWEEMIPGMGRPEQVILDQASLEDIQVFVGILWNRFGTPTGHADSGTEEEFESAFKVWEDTSAIAI